jgi:hypothetical protein
LKGQLLHGAVSIPFFELDIDSFNSISAVGGISTTKIKMYEAYAMSQGGFADYVLRFHRSIIL